MSPNWEPGPEGRPLPKLGLPPPGSPPFPALASWSVQHLSLPGGMWEPPPAARGWPGLG